MCGGGTLLIKGDNMHIKRLTLDQGEVDIDGSIDAYFYTGKKVREERESFFGRLFR